MSDPLIESLIVFLLILLNAVFAMSEMAVVSSRKARLQHRINEGDKRAQTALNLAENPGSFLSTVQIGITLVGVLAGAVGGAALSEPLSQPLAQIPFLVPYADELAFGIVVAIITVLSLIIGELVPKRLALQNPELLAMLVAPPMHFISRLFSPVVRLLNAMTDGVLWLMGVKPARELPVTEEELQVLLDQGTQAGVFQESEQDMVEAVFRLSDRRVYKMMTPRTEIAWLDIRDTPEVIYQKMSEAPFSRFPVCQGGLDNVVGIVRARDMLMPGLADKPLQLRDCLQPAYYIPETAFASGALQMFRETGRELVLVIDEFGSVAGLLTINDIMTEIVGDLATEEPQATQRQDGSWLLDGMLDTEEFKEIFHLDALPEEDNYETLGGFIMSQLGRIPAAADQMEWGGLRFEVMDMDGRRVDKALVTSLPVVKPVESEP